MPVAVDVGEIGAHATEGNLAQREGIEFAEASPAAVDPKPVGRPVIVADVEVGRAVAVEVAEGGGQTPVQRRMAQWFSFGVVERAVGEGNGSEVGKSVAQVENIRLAEFLDRAGLQRDAVAQ